MKHGMSHMLLGSEGGWGCKALSASAGANGRNYTRFASFFWLICSLSHDAPHVPPCQGRTAG